MSNNACDKILAAIAAEPWLIQPERLEQIVSIANRYTGDIEAALAVKAERGADALPGMRDKTAVIPVFGTIFPRATLFDMISGGISLACLNDQLDEALADPAIEAIVFNFDSPGGQSTGINEFANRIREAGKQKPITGYVSGVAASAAYWLACATGRIVADRTAVVGSIGTVCAWIDDSAVRKAQGLKSYVVVSAQSPKKCLDPASPAGMTELQNHLNDLAAIFIDQVATFRGTTAKKVASDFGAGGVLFAEAALDVGMIDAVGGLDDVIRDSAVMRRPKGIGMKGSKMALANMTAKDKVKNSGKDETLDEDEKEAKGKAADKTPHDDDEDEECPKKAKANADDLDEDDEDEEEKDTTDAHKAAKKAKANDPALYAAAYKAGIRAERGRIQAIRDLNLPGHKKLVERAMFQTPMSAGELALAYVRADKEMRQTNMEARLKESNDMSVPANLTDPGMNDSDAKEKDMLIKAMAGLPST